jgi:hypothetical protein
MKIAAWLGAFVILFSSPVLKAAVTDPPITEDLFNIDSYDQGGGVFGPTEPSPIPGDDYAVLFVDVQVGAGAPVQEWFELPYPQDTIPQTLFTNDTTDSITLSNAKFFLSDTQIPLDQLNGDFLTPPGSSFQPVPSFDTTLAPNASTSSTELPEPASLTFVVVAFATLMRPRRRSAT